MMDHVQHGPLHFPAGLITVRQCRRMMIEQADAVLLQGIRHLGKIHMKQIPIGKKIPAEMRAENNGGIGGSLCDPFCAPFDFVMDSGIPQFQIRPLNPPTDGSHFFTFIQYNLFISILLLILDSQTHRQFMTIGV